MFNILLLGAQGSGKGTQSDRLSEKLNIPSIAVGHLFRVEIEKGTGLGDEIQSFIKKGERVKSVIVNQLMSGRLSEDDTANGVILDGYPRTSHQKDFLEKIFADSGRALTHVLYLKVDDEVALRRLSARVVCKRCGKIYNMDSNPPKEDKKHCDRCGNLLMQRSDDTPEAIQRRLDLYHKDTQPLIDYYRKLGILNEIDANQPLEQVERDIDGALGLA